MNMLVVTQIWLNISINFINTNLSSKILLVCNYKKRRTMMTAIEIIILVAIGGIFVYLFKKNGGSGGTGGGNGGGNGGGSIQQ